MLKRGGILVYSTCSFSRRQNENIIAWFLNFHSNARLDPIPGHENVPAAASLAIYYPDHKDMHHVLRLSPNMSKTGGFFVARIRKL